MDPSKTPITKFTVIVIRMQSTAGVSLFTGKHSILVETIRFSVCVIALQVLKTMHAYMLKQSRPCSVIMVMRARIFIVPFANDLFRPPSDLRWIWWSRGHCNTPTKNGRLRICQSIVCQDTTVCPCDSLFLYFVHGYCERTSCDWPWKVFC